MQHVVLLNTPNEKTAFLVELPRKVSSRLPFPRVSAKPQYNFIKLLQLR